MADRVHNVLFLCTGNSARSILAETILNRYGAGRFHGYSAGSHPKGKVHPLTFEALSELGYLTEGLRSKSWDEFAKPGAPQMDFVFTVCSDAQGEVCPVWPGHPITAHWGIEDPAAVEGPEIERKAAFLRAAHYLRNRITAFVNLPHASIDRMALQHEVRQIGALDGASASRREKA